jgi:hypothetical protein
VLLFSGPVSEGEAIASQIRPQVASLPHQSIAQVAEKVKTAYSDLQRKRVEETILNLTL